MDSGGGERERAELHVDILRLVEEHQPPIVACELYDAVGRLQVFVDKVYIFSPQPLSEDSSYPQPGTIRGEIIEAWKDSSGRELVRVTTDIPDHVESTEGMTEFVVLPSQLSPCHSEA